MTTLLKPVAAAMSATLLPRRPDLYRQRKNRRRRWDPRQHLNSANQSANALLEAENAERAVAREEAEEEGGEAEEEGRQEIVENLSQILTAGGGQVDNVETWGRRRLAYPINKTQEGYYYFIQGQFSSSVLSELERTAKLSEGILRHMVVRQDP